MPITLPNHRADLVDLHNQVAAKLRDLDRPALNLTGGENVRPAGGYGVGVQIAAGTRIQYKFSRSDSWNEINSITINTTRDADALLGAVYSFRVAAALPRTIRTQTVSTTFFVHDGSSARPHNVKANQRIMYIHRDTGKTVITSSSKLSQWSQVTFYRILDKSNFALFINSKNDAAVTL